MMRRGRHPVLKREGLAPLIMCTFIIRLSPSIARFFRERDSGDIGALGNFWDQVFRLDISRPHCYRCFPFAAYRIPGAVYHVTSRGNEKKPSSPNHLGLHDSSVSRIVKGER
jgi:hypothetical protein